MNVLDRLNLTLTTERLSRLKWILPLAMAVLVLSVELLEAFWYRSGVLGNEFVVDGLVYGTAGPLLVFWLLDILQRWLAERETSALQARLLARAQEHLRDSHTLSDATLQSLFATSLYLNDVHQHTADLPQQAREELDAAHHALDAAIRDLRAHLIKTEARLR